MRSSALTLGTVALICGLALGASTRPALAAHNVTPLKAPRASHHRAAHLHHSAAEPAGAAARTELFDLINAERARAGVAPLRLDPALDAIAEARSQDMIDRHYFSHYIPGGGMVFDILNRDHIPYQMAGENIALNDYINFYALDQTVRQTNTDLMNSPEHRANILEPRYNLLGLGLAFESGTGKLIVTEDFVQS